MTLFRSILGGGRDGHYDDKGQWQRTKFCFMSCGDRCTCGPPNGMYYSPIHDKSKEKKGDDDRTGNASEGAEDSGAGGD